MSHRDIPDAAVAENAPLSSYLARAFRDNILALDHWRQSIDALLNETTGHKHDGTTASYDYTFTDTIKTITGVNDKIDFIFVDTVAGYVLTTEYTATLTEDTRTLTAHAAHVQAQMRVIVSTGPTVNITCSYDDVEGSPSRGLFGLRNTAAAGSRRFEILGGTGSNFATSALPSMGFAKLDRKKSLGYNGDSGFLSSFLANQIILAQGVPVPEAGFQDDAFTATKFSPGVCTNPKFQDESVGGGQTASGALRGDKWGEAITATPQLATSSPITFSVDLPGRTSAGDIPMVSVFIGPFATSTHVSSTFFGVTVSHSGGETWSISVSYPDPLFSEFVSVRVW